MKILPLLTLAGLLVASCASVDTSETEAAPAPESKAAKAAAGERVQPEVRYYVVGDT